MARIAFHHRRNGTDHGLTARVVEHHPNHIVLAGKHGEVIVPTKWASVTLDTNDARPPTPPEWRNYES